MLNKDDLQLVIKTLPGLENVLAREVKLLGGRNVKEIKRGVTATGDIGFVYKANLWLRTALRILVTIDNFKIRDEDSLYKQLKKIAWEELFDVNKSMVIDATVFSHSFKNSLFIAQRSKDAIADRFRETVNERPSVNTREPDVRINVHISGNNCAVSLDSSGDSLHKRNYRQHTDRAPLNEVLAAGLLELSGWDKKSSFVDPMCGSGTILIEAAMMAYNIPPNVFRKNFCFRNWKAFDQELFGLIFDKSLEKEEDFKGQIVGFDIDERVLSKANQNIRRALMQDQIEVHEADFTAFDKKELLPARGTAVFNPPYDIKLEADIPELYKSIGNTLKDHFSGYSAWIFSASEEGLKSIHMKARKKYKLMNAKLDAWLVGFEIF